VSLLNYNLTIIISCTGRIHTPWADAARVSCAARGARHCANTVSCRL
jgi:hypothetical protein